MKRYPKTIRCAGCGKTARFEYREDDSDPGVYRCGACGDITDAATHAVCGGGANDQEIKILLQ